MCLLLLAIASIANAQSEVNRISLHVGSVTLGDTPSSVRKALGKPRSVRQLEIEFCGHTKVLRYQYPGTTIQFSYDSSIKAFSGADRVEVRRANWEVAPGARIGSSYKSVRRILGNPRSEMKLRGNVTEAYYVTTTNDEAQLTFYKHRLWKVAWFVNPC